MDTTHHRFADLFAQLGLPSDEAAMRRFIREHAPLAGDIRLEEAAFWTPQQARLLRELCIQDADWAPVVDQLNASLRSAGST
jgi:Protein of unknown function (DUF2789)